MCLPRFALLALLPALVACSGVTPPDQHYGANFGATIHVNARKKIIGALRFYDPSIGCVALDPDFTVVMPPKLGQLYFMRKLGEENPKECPGMMLPYYDIYYQAGPKTGVDDFVYKTHWRHQRGPTKAFTTPSMSCRDSFRMIKFNENSDEPRLRVA